MLSLEEGMTKEIVDIKLMDKNKEVKTINKCTFMSLLLVLATSSRSSTHVLFFEVGTTNLLVRFNWSDFSTHLQVGARNNALAKEIAQNVEVFGQRARALEGSA